MIRNLQLTAYCALNAVSELSRQGNAFKSTLLNQRATVTRETYIFGKKNFLDSQLTFIYMI